MILGYIPNNQLENALHLYKSVHGSSIKGSRSTFSSLFHACSCLGSLQTGKLLHVQLTKTPLTSNVYVGTSLVDMYATCGSVNDARLSFIRIVNPNVAAYTVVRSTNLYTTNVFIRTVNPNVAAYAIVS
ncbi:putative tetratricopeptide-like helical domain superfamily [Helianthus annuus]|nr:putative tetratricopeptide-like helical domain superfamily [Helianthus annuus]KAJ0718050.1 putative tetratricopeptide-like helical domain superfamily [Helianthus annuus]KAJ0721286.1 putative tetratricopeptide-like helical domain superfamily [Helianthus annuus]